MDGQEAPALFDDDDTTRLGECKFLDCDIYRKAFDPEFFHSDLVATSGNSTAPIHSKTGLS